MDNVTKLFKTSAFGFNRSDVINYIEKTRNDFYDYRIQSERTISDLNEKIKELEEALASKNSLLADSQPSDNIDFSSSVSQINEAADHLRETADKICDDIGDFLDKILSTDKEIITNENLINEISTECSEVKESIDENNRLTDSFEENSDTSQNEADGFMSQFSQIINNAFAEKREAEASECNDKKDSDSILDGLLGSSVFSL